MASSLGSGLEMYDFIIYVFFSQYIAAQFFPSSNQLNSVLLALSAFAIGYLCRGLGAFLFGHLGDKRGRKKSLLFTITLMAIPIIGITLLPTYHSIGIAAPILLTLLRALQGLAVGGEFSGAVTIVSELAPPKRKGFYTSLIIFSLNVGILVASIVAMFITNWLIIGKGLLWAWRIAFAIGFILIIIGIIIRRHVEESPAFLALQEKKQLLPLPAAELIQKHHKKLLSMAFVTCGAATAVGVLVFVPIYIRHYIALPQHLFSFNNSFDAALCLSVLLSGYLTDKIGCKAMYCIALVLTIIIVVPLGDFLTAQRHVMPLEIGFIVLGIPLGLILGVFSGYLAEHFASPLRTTGIGLAYNIPFTLITGPFPALSIYIIKTSGQLAYQYAFVIVLLVFALSHLLAYRQK